MGIPIDTQYGITYISPIPANTAATIRTPDSRDSEMIPQPHNDSFSGTDWSKYEVKASSSLVDYSEASSNEGALE